MSPRTRRSSICVPTRIQIRFRLRLAGVKGLQLHLNPASRLRDAGLQIQLTPRDFRSRTAAGDDQARAARALPTGRGTVHTCRHFAGPASPMWAHAEARGGMTPEYLTPEQCAERL